MLLTLGLLTLALPTVRAQNRPGGVAVAGSVRDPRGSPVANATVALMQGTETQLPTQLPTQLSTQLATQVATKTDAAGRFRFENVFEGNYSVEVQHDGFEMSVTPLQVQTKAPAPLAITLALALVVTKVTVVGEEQQVSTDITSNRDAASVDNQLLEKVPVFDQDYVTAMSAFLDPSAVGTSGVQTIVNGVEVSSVTVSASAVQEVRIN